LRAFGDFAIPARLMRWSAEVELWLASHLLDVS
jgi:hypothetical protein